MSSLLKSSKVPSSVSCMRDGMSFQCTRDAMYCMVALLLLDFFKVEWMKLQFGHAMHWGILLLLDRIEINSIIRSGGVSMLLGPCNSADAELAVLNHQELCFFCVEKVIQVRGGVVV